MDFSGFEVLSFDCYGTLVDWESGILSALRPLLAAREVAWDDDRILSEYAAAEAELEAGPYLSYKDVLEGVVARIASRAGFKPTVAQRRVLRESQPRWAPFPDTVAALADLGRRFKLVIISNVDDDLFAGTARALPVSFHAVITAEQVRAYKPSLANFRMAMELVRIPRERWLHVGASLFHDVSPARTLGLASVWVNRRHGRSTGGASPHADVAPDLEVPDLATLAQLAHG